MVIFRVSTALRRDHIWYEGDKTMPLVKSLISTTITLFSVAMLSGCVSPIDNRNAADTFIQDPNGPPNKIPIKAVFNKNGKYFLDVPGLKKIHCTGEMVVITYVIIGSPGVTFPQVATDAIKVEQAPPPAPQQFSNYTRVDDKTITVEDLCTVLDYFKYDVTVLNPSNVPVTLDPLIKNYW